MSKNLHLQALPQHVDRPALAAAGEMLAMGDQALVQLAGQQGDAVDASVAQSKAGLADLAAANLEQHDYIEIRSHLDGGLHRPTTFCHLQTQTNTPYPSIDRDVRTSTTALLSPVPAIPAVALIG